MTIQDALIKASTRIERRDAEVLLRHLLRRDPAWLRAHPEASLTQEESADFAELVARRAEHWPLQYLTGRQEFFGLDLEVSRGVLIPRPETELLVEAVLEWSKDKDADREWQMVDVGTGSGAIALALVHALPKAHVAALDISLAARAMAERNAERTALAARVRVLNSDLLSVFADETQSGRRIDVVVSNPPYVPAGDAASMQPEVREFEPHLALFAGEDGLEMYRRLIPQAWDVLRQGGLLAMEFGFGQRDALAVLLQDWSEVHFRDDYAGIPRLVLAERP